MKNWHYGRWVLATSFIFQLSNQGYLWIAGGFLSLEDVGKIRAVLNLLQPLYVVIGSISLIMLPRLSALYYERLINNFKSLVSHATIIAVIVAIVYFVIIYLTRIEIINIIYGNKYVEISDSIIIYGLNLPVYSIGVIHSDAIKAMGFPKLIFYGYSFSGGVTIFFGIPLVYFYGINGAGLGMLMSSLSYTIFIFYKYIFIKNILLKENN